MIPFTIRPGDTTDDIKIALNSQLQTYNYFVYNGQWVVKALDIIEAIDRSFDSVDPINNELYGNYGYTYYTGDSRDALSIEDQLRVNTIYNLAAQFPYYP